MLRSMRNLTLSIAILYQLACRARLQVPTTLFDLATIGARVNSRHDAVMLKAK